MNFTKSAAVYPNFVASLFLWFLSIFLREFSGDDFQIVSQGSFTHDIQKFLIKEQLNEGCLFVSKDTFCLQEPFQFLNCCKIDIFQIINFIAQKLTICEHFKLAVKLRIAYFKLLFRL